jgi:hypothetical protein
VVQEYYERELDLGRHFDEVRALPQLDELTAQVGGDLLHGRLVWFVSRVGISINTFHVRVGNSRDHVVDRARVQEYVDRIAALGSIQARREWAGIGACLVEF